MEELIFLDELNEFSVSVVTKKYIINEGVKYFVGDLHRVAYVNSTSGRADISRELSEPYLSAVINIWGDTPLVPEPEIENHEAQE